MPFVETAIAKPPALRWLLVLILSLVTFGLFEDAWLLWQARWAKKVDPGNRSMMFLVGGVLLFLIGGAVSAFSEVAYLAGWVEIGGLVLSQVGNFSVKGTMEKHYNVALSGLMTIFFSSIYFQYHFDRLARKTA